MRAKDLVTLLNSLIKVHGEDIPVYLGSFYWDEFEYYPIENKDIKVEKYCSKDYLDRITIG